MTSQATPKRRRFRTSALLALVAGAVAHSGVATAAETVAVDRVAWLADLAQIRVAIDRDYPNRDWLTGQREVSLDPWFERAADQIRASRVDAEARQALDSLLERFNDGHLALHWPSRSAPDTIERPGPSQVLPPTPAAFCAAHGYDAGQVTAGTAASLPGYRPMDGGGPFGAGLVDAAGRTVGVIRIGVFSPQGYPMLCQEAVEQAQISFGKSCDDACEARLLTEAYALLTRGLMETVERLRTGGAQLLLIDLTRNGGGTEWAEAAARIVSPVALRSAPVRVLRGEAWVSRWQALASKLRRAAAREPADRTMLFDLAKQADAISSGLKPCAEPTCPPLAPAGFASGLIAELPAGRFDGRTWAPDVFSPAQFPYHESMWKGPLIVLVDSETWSAAEEFTALLRDNDAAIVMGTRTGGAGCGHLEGNDPVTLSYSKATLEMPNCARFRRDGTNEVGGIVPDVPTGVRWNDGTAFAGRITIARLPEAVEQAIVLYARSAVAP